MFPYRKAIRLGALARAPGRPGVVEDPGMHVHSLHGNREICGLALAGTAGARIGKVRNPSR